MNRALATAVCAVFGMLALGCASTHEPQLDAPAANQGADGTIADELPPAGGAGMSAEPDERGLVAQPDEPQAADPACASLARLAARDGTIEFLDDGSARVSVWLENTSDEDTFDYPGMSVWWSVAQRYAGGDGGELFLYGLFAHQRVEHVFVIEPDLIARGQGGVMEVHATPFTLATRDADLGCEAAIELELSALVPFVEPEQPAQLAEPDAVDPACTSLARLVARDGTIQFLDDGNAKISVWLENTSDEDVYDNPGIHVGWHINNRYSGGDGDLLLYGLLARQRVENVMIVERNEMMSGEDSMLVAHAMPFTLATRDPNDRAKLGCEAPVLELSAPVPPPPSLY